MAIIKKINAAQLKREIPNKIPVKEKWEQYRKRISQKLNERTRHWERKHKKRFLMAFCTGFTALLVLSFCFLDNPDHTEKSVRVPMVSQQILLQEKRIRRASPHPLPQKVSPFTTDSTREKTFIHPNPK